MAISPVHAVHRFGGRGQAIVNRMLRNNAANARAVSSRQSSSRTSSLSAGSSSDAVTRFSLPASDVNTGNSTQERQLPLSQLYGVIASASVLSPSINAPHILFSGNSKLGNLIYKKLPQTQAGSRKSAKAGSSNASNGSYIIDGIERPLINSDGTSDYYDKPSQEQLDIIAQTYQYNAYQQLDMQNGTNYAEEFRNKQGNEDKRSKFSSSVMSDMAVSSQAVEQAGGLSAYLRQQELLGTLNKQTPKTLSAAA